MSVLDQKWMQLALAEAEKGVGKTHPNPRVGAVIVRDDVVLAKGYHHVYGGDHAELDALKCVAGDVVGATMYVTLEPCAATGKTPACTTALIESGIRRVVFASSDPHPVMAGGGQILRQAGLEVVEGVEQTRADRLNRPFFHYLQTGQPWLIAKAAISLDGKLATRTHHSQWISGEESRQHAHQLRAICDAIVVGVGTLLNDNPSLTVRGTPCKGEPPLRVVMAKEAPQPFSDCQLLSDAANTRFYVTQSSAYDQRWRDLGVEVVYQPDLKACFQHLATNGCLQVLLEGGGQLHGACLAAKLSQEVVFYQAPMLIGGLDAVSFWHGLGVARITDALRFEHLQYQALGDDMLIRGDIIYPT